MVQLLNGFAVIINEVNLIFLEKLTLTELCLKARRRYRKKICFQIYRDGGVYNRFNYTEFGGKIISFASMLIKMGIKKGDRVMIMSENALNGQSLTLAPPWQGG